MTNKIDAVILANGEYPTQTQPLDILNKASYVVCCDGAADAFIEKGHVPDAIIGDGDSLSEENRTRYSSILHYDPDQETNDQTKAVNYLLKQGINEIAIVGATGKREDHALGNISLLIDYMRNGANIRMLTDYGIFIPCRDTKTFSCIPTQQVSIFNFGTSGLHAEGLVYPIRDFTNWWQGTLNECTGDQFTIHAKGEYLIFLNY